MARFALVANEVKLSEYKVRLSEERKWREATVVLTSERLVVINAHTVSPSLMFLGPFAGLFSSAKDREHISHTIRRDRFAELERGDSGQLIFRDRGEGYARTSFAISSKESFEVWQERLHRWLAGATTAAPLPAARLRED